jgi:hypothetical protein
MHIAAWLESSLVMRGLYQTKKVRLGAYCAAVGHPLIKHVRIKLEHGNFV